MTGLFFAGWEAGMGRPVGGWEWRGIRENQEPWPGGVTARGSGLPCPHQGGKGDRTLRGRLPARAILLSGWFAELHGGPAACTACGQRGGQPSGK